MDRYNIKRIKTKNYEEIYIKNATDNIPKGRKGVKEKRKLPRKEFSSMNILEQRAAINRKKKYYKNKRYEIARIIDLNHGSNTKFITLTFRDNTELDITNYEEAKLEFDKFMKRLRNYINQLSEEYQLKYLAVHEIQKKRSAFHYHMVCFDFPYISNKKLNEIWGLGFVKINKVPNTVENANIGIYISKYFTKEENDVHSRNKYYSSRNLIKPEVSYELIAKDGLKEYIEANMKSNVEQMKEYTYKRPYFAIQKASTIEEVEVTYIRKKIV